MPGGIACTWDYQWGHMVVWYAQSTIMLTCCWLDAGSLPVEGTALTYDLPTCRSAEAATMMIVMRLGVCTCSTWQAFGTSGR